MKSSTQLAMFSLLAILTSIEAVRAQETANHQRVSIVKEEPAGEVQADFSQLESMPDAVTSFGAAVLDGHLYVYGGHHGGAHEYSADDQGKTLWRIALSDDAEWEAVADGPGLQGLALITDGDSLYRIGGFSARNATSEEHDLWSVDTVARFNPQEGEWQEMPPLPQPRSSFDAAVLDGVIYVVGGWQLQGEKDAVWHNTAYGLDLNADEPVWKPIAEPPFRRRAVSVAANGGKLYVIGGMQQRGGPTTKVAVYDPQDDSWSDGPAIQGEGMSGFGSSSFAVNGQLYVSTYDGNLQCLDEKANEWRVVRDLEAARFFHRMVPDNHQRLLMIGGANMSEGKFDDVEIVEVGR